LALDVQCQELVQKPTNRKELEINFYLK
jgi:hypothetical protein